MCGALLFGSFEENRRRGDRYPDFYFISVPRQLQIVASLCTRRNKGIGECQAINNRFPKIDHRPTMVLGALVLYTFVFNS